MDVQHHRIVICTFFIIVHLLNYIMTYTLSALELKTLFGKETCIEGAFMMMPYGTKLIISDSSRTYQYDFASEINSENLNVSSIITDNVNIKEKTAMCLINELAQYNEIDHQYRLTKEFGPAHEKLFTVSLKLHDEEYEGEGTSIKKAQQSAAAIALQKTRLQHPPSKVNGKSRYGSGNTPTVTLNMLAMKRGEKTVYVLENGVPDLPPNFISQAPTFYPKHNLNGPGQPKYNYDPRHNNTGWIYLPTYENRHSLSKLTEYHHPPGQPFSIRLHVGERVYQGAGYTIKAARHDAAAQAVEDIKRLELTESQQCLIDNVASNEIPRKFSNALKSPISLVYELASKRKLDVTFELLSESGPPHKKIFVTRCRVGDVTADGTGSGKKASKKDAAEKMLEELRKFDPIFNVDNQPSPKPKAVKKKKQRSIIRDVDGDSMSVHKASLQSEHVANAGKIKFKDKHDVKIGGSGGRVLAPGVVLANEQSMELPRTKPKIGDIGISDLGQTAHVVAKILQSEDIGTKGELLYVAQLLGVQVQFSDLLKTKDSYVALVSLGTQPPHLCIGEGFSIEHSHENASKEALAKLTKMGLDKVTTNTKESFTDNEAIRPPLKPRTDVDHNDIKK